jgi:hypothetical protein
MVRRHYLPALHRRSHDLRGVGSSFEPEAWLESIPLGPRQSYRLGTAESSLVPNALCGVRGYP